MSDEERAAEAKKLAETKNDRELLVDTYCLVHTIDGRCQERAVHCPGVLAAQAQQGNGITVRMSGKNIGPALKAALPWLLVILSVIFGKPIADTILPPAAQPKPAQEAPK